jgi:hypothetical protein
LNASRSCNRSDLGSRPNLGNSDVESMKKRKEPPVPSL